MELEAYFDFLSPEDIRLKGSRIGIETVLYEYLHRGQTPEAITARYPSITLEQVYATITYYLHNTAAVRDYLEAWLTHERGMREAQEQNPPSVLTRLRVEALQRQANEAHAS